MIDRMIRLFALMNLDNRGGYEIGGHDIDAIRWPEGEHGKSSQGIESLHHIELRGLWPPTVSHDDRRAKNDVRYIGEQLIDHVLGKFLRTRVGIVVGTRPINRGIFRD